MTDKQTVVKGLKYLIDNLPHLAHIAGELKPIPEPPAPTSRTAAERADELYRLAIAEGYRGEELASFMGQMHHESSGYSRVIESLNYSIAGLRATFPTRLTVAQCNRLGRQPGEKTVPTVRQMEIANIVYGGRMGNTNPNDGWLFRGRGLIQLTGRNNYTFFAEILGVDLANSPDLASSEQYIYKIAIAFWNAVVRPAIKRNGLTLNVITKAINGGTNGLADRRKQTDIWLERVKKDGLI